MYGCCCEAIPAFISQVWTLFVLIQLLFDFKSGPLLRGVERSWYLLLGHSVLPCCNVTFSKTSGLIRSVSSQRGSFSALVIDEQATQGWGPLLSAWHHSAVSARNCS